MHFMHVWIIGDVALQKVAIVEMQMVVSFKGAHGGNVVIFKDQDLFRKPNNVLNKPSFNGTHANKEFERNVIDASVIP